MEGMHGKQKREVKSVVAWLCSSYPNLIRRHQGKMDDKVKRPGDIVLPFGKFKGMKFNDAPILYLD